MFPPLLLISPHRLIGGLKFIFIQALLQNEPFIGNKVERDTPRPHPSPRMQPVTVRRRSLKQKRQDGYYCVCEGKIAAERRRTGKEAGSETNTVKIRRKLITDRPRCWLPLRACLFVCVYVCVCIIVVYEGVNLAGLCSTRCPRVRRADASQVVRCCALWPPVPRRSASTRSTSRISAVPSARVVSRNDLGICLSIYLSIC